MGTFLENPQLHATLTKLHDGLTQLRFTEGLRRHSDVARTETNLHFANDLAALQGINLPLTNLRELTLEKTTPTTLEENQALAYWQMQLWISQQWPTLNPPKNGRGKILSLGRTPTTTAQRPSVPLPQTLATLHRIAGAKYQRRTEKLGMPSPTAQKLINQIWETTEIPAILRAGLLVAQNHLTPIFDFESTTTIHTVARHLLVASGAEPTGCLQYGIGLRTHQNRYHQTLKTLAETGATPETLTQWLMLWTEILNSSLEKSHQLIRHVQAGKLPVNTQLIS